MRNFLITIIFSTFITSFLSLPVWAKNTPDIQSAEIVASSSEASEEKLGTEELVGEAVAIHWVSLGTKVAGRLATVPLFPGDEAAKGATLAELEKRDFELAVEQAEAALEILQAKLRQMEVGSRPEERRTAEEQERQARANMENAEIDLKRAKDSFESGAAPKSNLDSAQARAIVTQAQYMAAKEQKAIVDKGPRIEDREAMQAQIRQQKAAVEMAKLQLDYATLRAPFDGSVAIRNADTGSYVTAQLPIYTFFQTDPIFFTVDCPEHVLPILEKGMVATFSVDSLPGRTFSGTLERIPPFVDSKSRNAKTQFTVENKDHILKPGMFVRAIIPLKRKNKQN
ncbi:MAG: efflux RND transporter periplasmic adaptor subunit [Candidatus Riflebacteria bacterium]|nr:efflux RND transporter periplasmic adaptor subunit [Candidatus Riflebacteria bacterium]